MAILMLLTCTPTAGAGASTLVRFNTSLGAIDVRLFDSATPASVQNFLNYVADGDYTDSFIHRAPPGFVIQGGGFNWPEGGGIGSVPTDPPVVNEPGLTNVRGTLAYAKQGGNPNSATSGWFFSVDDNSANLDFQNGGFTVFGSIVNDTLDTLDALAGLTVLNAGAPFETLPVLDSFEPPTIFREDIVFVHSVEQLDLRAGDYDFDGDVDADDYGVWQAQFGASLRIADHQAGSPAITLDADGNGDGLVDAADYAIWRDSLGQTVVAGVGVPEPAGVVVMVGAIAAASLAVARRFLDRVRPRD